MARLPDVASLGNRPVPVDRGGIVSRPNAGVVGRALEGLGGQAQQIAGEQFEKQDKLAYAAAKTAILKADVQARQGLDKDQDYGTFESRYTEQMRKAREEAGKLIRNASDRALFDSDVDLDFERGRSQVLELANRKRVLAEGAVMETSLDELADAGLNAPDDATRAAIIKNANDILDGAVASGVLDPQSAGRKRREWANNYVATQVTSALLREDVDKATSIYEQNLSLLDWNTALDMSEKIKRFTDNRQSAEDALSSAPGYVAVDSDAEQPSVGSMLKAIISNESRGRQFDDSGKPLTSSAGAIGIMQVMPATGPEAAKLAGLPWDPERFRSDSAYNQALGTAYFKKQLETFGDPVKAAAAYNAGPRRVQKALKKHGGNWLSVMPDETKEYVANFQLKTGAQQSARTWDKESWYANIDQKADAEGWSFERRERAKSYADRQIARDEQLLARREDEADRSASEVILNLGNKFTDTAQIPRDVWSRMSTTARASAMNAAEANSKPKEVAADGETVTRLELLRVKSPKQFASINLGEYAHLMTPAELNQLRKDQAEIQAEGPGKELPLRAKVSGTIGTYETPDMWADDKNDAAKQRVRVQRIMEAEIRKVTGGKREPSEQELYQSFIGATGTALTYKKTFLGFETGGKRDVRRYDLTIDDVPEKVASRIRSALKTRSGKDPSDEQVAEEYAMYKGRYW